RWEQDAVLGLAFFNINLGTKLHHDDAAGIRVRILLHDARDNSSLQFSVRIVGAVCFYFAQALEDCIADSRCSYPTEVGGRVIKFRDDLAVFVAFGNNDGNSAGISINTYAGL